MHFKKLTFATAVFTAAFFLLGSVSVFASTSILKKDMEGSEITALQKDLKKLGYITIDPTGFYGDLTVEAVKKLQAEYGYDADGVAGETTLALIDRLLGRDDKAPSAAVTANVLKEGSKGDDVLALQKDHRPWNLP